MILRNMRVATKVKQTEQFIVILGIIFKLIEVNLAVNFVMLLSYVRCFYFILFYFNLIDFL